ncbi:dynein heavy chain at 93AB [Oratosquilla oratoria]|uniref:dynein heavy chain at 93AB n=1 Tax=Oratosquilla oratoria TaxID=337810 RepID=UPI003F75DA3B
MCGFYNNSKEIFLFWENGGASKGTPRFLSTPREAEEGAGTLPSDPALTADEEEPPQESPPDEVPPLGTTETSSEVGASTPRGTTHWFMPPVVATLKKLQEVHVRVDAHFARLSLIKDVIIGNEECEALVQQWTELSQKLKDLGEAAVDHWRNLASADYETALCQPLLRRRQDKTIAVNFSIKLVETLQELKYGWVIKTFLGKGAELAARRDVFRNYTANLQLMADWYNRIRTSTTEVERNLIQQEMEKIDETLRQAETDLTWSSEGVSEFIEVITKAVGDLENRVTKSKRNLARVEEQVAQWSTKPLFERKDGKKDAFLYLVDRNDRLKKFYACMERDGQLISSLMKENRDLLNVEPDCPHWAEYLRHIDQVITRGLADGVTCSLTYLIDNCEPRVNQFPLIEVRLELQEPHIVLKPSPDELKALASSLVSDLLQMATLVPRLDPNSYQTFKPEVEKEDEVMTLQGALLVRFEAGATRMAEHRDSFMQHSALWRDRKSDILNKFLSSGEGGTQPALSAFKQQIDKYEALHSELEQIDTSVVIDKWLSLDVSPFKHDLLVSTKKWSHMFKLHLINQVIESLTDLDKFIKDTEVGVAQDLGNGDYDILISIMGYLVGVRDRLHATDALFDPLRATISLVKEYGEDLPETMHLKLQELPEQWEALKKQCDLVRQHVAPLKASEAASIRKRCIKFEGRQITYREKFKKYSFFNYDCYFPYWRLERVHERFLKLEEEMTQLQESATLFEVVLSDFKQIKVCRKELRLLKILWDHIFLVRACIEHWKKTPWREIDVENMDIECKKFAKDIRALDKEMRSWDAYVQLDSTVKNMLTSLRAVAELQNPSLRERHWAQLMVACKKAETTGDKQVSFVNNPDTTLADLLDLNLHSYEDEVKNIVDKAVKEMSMEKIIKELEITWSSMEFDLDRHPRTGINLIRASEEMIETLEENQVQLQTLLTSKYIEHFLHQVSAWQQKLSLADQVITIWFEVQRTWSHLESIFIGSDDIRRQLPEDSARFDQIDIDFKELVKEMVANMLVLEATNRPGLVDRLEALQEQLSLCEKTLAQYLETKRLAFPRFYFVSTADLLDILSNGNQPTKVCRHLTKLFDSMARLKFGEEEGSREAVGMWARDGEYVAFCGPADCTGPVEGWLGQVLAVMRRTMREVLTEAVAMYEEAPRERWAIEYPAQMALTGTQIWWTLEVNSAFERLEEGYENALRDYYRKQVQQLNTLISLLLGELTKEQRQKIMTICTIDVHARDVVAKLISQRVESSAAFSWQSQLRHRWDDDDEDCFVNICDAQFHYAHEYLGNTPRLVITPLTDRCYITLTQSLHLVMGGAPSGPAGTGKTETTKDLGRALGMMVYVFNCSEQMDYKSCGNIYKGLAQTGAWGCFDEFNRISVEVLSVVAVQVKSVQDAIRFKRSDFDFMGEEIHLTPTVGIFITMNPGYAGRTELPENLKALFRPCAMVVPDLELICEIMLVAEGFIEAKVLARKFITLYRLCRELLSKQDHYDWGLRAIKSLLVVAGSLKRDEPDRPEDQVLMRALRDYNVPKIVTDDVPVFMGLIGDLFPALDVPRKKNTDFEKAVKQAACDLTLQPEDSFVLKVIQLQELLEVRHSVFIIGGAGTGKTQVWRTLFKTFHNMKKRPILSDLNPKAVTTDELFGYINASTREWKDGLFSSLMRDQANMTGDSPKWIVLDGDIDPMWIESLNTLMDDNKILTLASNERISLTPQMRLIFEISSLRTATPATVSRAGIIYLNQQDLGWNPYVTSWLDRREIQSEKVNLMVLFDKYIPTCLEVLRVKFKKITPVPEITHLQMLCQLLECLLTTDNVPAESPKEFYETYFVFACVWAFGSAMYQDGNVDYRVEFSKWWQQEFKTIKFPGNGTVFDYFIEKETLRFAHWSEKIPNLDLDLDIPVQSILVHTAETVRLRYILDLLMARRYPVMLVGNSGCGKTALINEKLSTLPEDHAVCNVPFNYYTTSELLQRVLEKPLEKKAGRNYAPPGNKRLVYFVDDINMPMVDMYGTVQPHTLMRQHLDYGHWYDRAKHTLKEVSMVQYVAAMNPTAGSFTINPRLQRHFSVLAVSFPHTESLGHIYATLLDQHLRNPVMKFQQAMVKLGKPLVDSALQLHSKVTSTFMPTATKFHYIFNLRDLTNIFQGLLFCTGETVRGPMDLVRAWLHESQRVYGDRLLEEKDLDTLTKLQTDVVKKAYEELDESDVFAQPNVLCHFARGMGEPRYLPILSWADLSNILKEALNTYNELNAAMNLVLFEDAMAHVCRINRILECPRGNALLVGVGGSGKQSLARLAAFISGLEVFQLTLTKDYGLQELRTDLAMLYVRAGMKNLGTVFLMTDAHIPDEKFLVLINDLLASGEIPDLFPEDEVENIITSVRNEVKGAGLQDNRENCWRFFIDRVRRNLKMVLCFSPVGATLRVRARQFPAIISCTTIDWFHEWPHEALISVSTRFLQETTVIPETLMDPAARFMAHVHTSVNAMSKNYLTNERRYNYTTPKTFLGLIALFSRLLTTKHNELQGKIQRLQNGLEKLRTTSAQVDDLKAKLASQEVELQKKNDEADKLIRIVEAETEKVSKENEVAMDEKRKVALIEVEVAKRRKDCEEDLVKAEPALIAAREALNTLNKANLTELKSFGSPPSGVSSVTAAVMVLLAPNGKIPKDRSWKTAKVMMAKVDQFLDQLINYNKEDIHPDVIKAIQPYLENPQFNPDFIRSKSVAAAGLCSWVINIIRFYEVYCDVEPKRRALEEANAELSAAQARLAAITTKIKDLEEELTRLRAEFEQARAEKMRCQQEADTTARTIQLANRLVGGLASENVRWAEAVARLHNCEKTLPGDVLLVSSFISYVGCFTKHYRIDLLDKMWMPFLQKQNPSIPITPHLDPITLLTDDAAIARWHNEGLPSDRMSTENAIILTSSDRWPLIIDPQLQGIKWIKARYGEHLVVLRLNQKNCLDALESSITRGQTVLLENLPENLDPVLDPLIGKNLIKKGKALKIGDKEIEYHPKFQLILHTKLANPHYKPELQAQCTLINFTVTRDGLEDQLLAEVVKVERPDLEELKYKLTKQQNDFKIELKTLEDDLLCRLSSAAGNFLGDTALVENLEHTKRTAQEIQEKVVEARETSIKIDQARELYRPAAARASLLYFILNDLHKINPIYQFSLKAFRVVFHKAMSRSEGSDDVGQRVDALIDNITYSVFLYISRGLFEKDKLIFAAQMTFQILVSRKEVSTSELDLLLRFPTQPNVVSPVDFLTNTNWGALRALAQMDEFRNIDRDIENNQKRWRMFCDCECPEKEKLPGDWKSKTDVQRLCIMRAIRPDRMTHAMQHFIEERMGRKYVEGKNIEFSQSYEESSPSTPIFFILSPGVDPLKDVERLGQQLGFSCDNRKLHNVSLGQGQERVAEEALGVAAKGGHWVILQNIHLVKKWLPRLEKKLEEHATGAHEDYRVFMSAEPANRPENHILPQGILESAIKMTNEPPRGMQANLHKALSNFSQETMEMCSRETEFKSLLFSLCYFHACVAERRKFGSQGWNRAYPFNTGDLTISCNVLYNYLENTSKVPWEDLRYLFGEIMYGGHITDDWDRRLCKTYLEEFLHPDQLDGELLLAPGFPAPANFDYSGYHDYIDSALPAESPHLYGLHPNAEIGFLTWTSEHLFKTVFELQPRDMGSAGGVVITREDKVKQMLDEILERLPDPFNMADIMGKVEERTPYVVVAFQECERMNELTKTIRNSLKEIDLGFKGELKMTSTMEELVGALFLDQVPDAWTKKAYASAFGLTNWYADLLLRVKELESWVADFQLPSSVWLAGFFNPQSFLTAIMQSTARKCELPLDQMCLHCDVTKKNKEEFSGAPREGAHVHGLFLEGAAWDHDHSILVDSRLKELHPQLPVLFIKAITQDKAETRNMYECPVYKTRQRGPTYVWTFNLKTKEKPAKWILAGVAILLQV